MAEFWADQRWPNARIPRGSAWDRIVCVIVGHVWGIHYWSGQGAPRWPQHEYCERCFRFRDRGA